MGRFFVYISWLIIAKKKEDKTMMISEKTLEKLDYLEQRINYYTDLIKEYVKNENKAGIDASLDAINDLIETRVGLLTKIIESDLKIFANEKALEAICL